MATQIHSEEALFRFLQACPRTSQAKAPSTLERCRAQAPRTPEKCRARPAAGWHSKLLPYTAGRRAGAKCAWSAAEQAQSVPGQRVQQHNTLDEVSDDGRAESSGQSTDTFGGDDLAEAADHTTVVHLGAQHQANAASGAAGAGCAFRCGRVCGSAGRLTLKHNTALARKAKQPDHTVQSAYRHQAGRQASRRLAIPQARAGCAS